MMVCAGELSLNFYLFAQANFKNHEYDLHESRYKCDCLRLRLRFQAVSFSRTTAWIWGIVFPLPFPRTFNRSKNS